MIRRLALAISVLAGLAFAPGTAEASCTGPSGELRSGEFVNVDPNSRSVRRAVFNFVCGDSQVCRDGVCSTAAGGDPHYTIQVFASCGGQDCDWGQRRLFRLPGTDYGFMATYESNISRQTVVFSLEQGGGMRMGITRYRGSEPPRTSQDLLRRR